MASTLTVIVAIMGVSLASLVAASSTTQTPTVSCTTAGEVMKYEVSKPGAVTLSCPTTYTAWVPKVEADTVSSVGTDQQCTSATALGTLCPGATGTVTKGAKAAGIGTITFTFPQLPTNTTMVYMGCQQAQAVSDDSGKAPTGCGFALTVKGYSPAGPQACAIAGSSVKLAVEGDGGKTVFSCGSDFTLYPTDLKKAYGSDCTKEEELKDLQLSKGDDGYFTLLATKKPPNKKYCYLCAKTQGKGQGGSNCAVLISVSAASGLAARSTFGIALSCALALLHFA